MAHIVARQQQDRLWYWYSIGSNGAELMRSNVGRRVRAGVELDLRVLKLLAAKPGTVAIDVSQSTRAGDWRSHLTGAGENEYEATSTVWFMQRADAECVGAATLAALR